MRDTGAARRRKDVGGVCLAQTGCQSTSLVSYSGSSGDGPVGSSGEKDIQQMTRDYFQLTSSSVFRNIHSYACPEIPGRQAARCMCSGKQQDAGACCSYKVPAGQLRNTGAIHRIHGWWAPIGQDLKAGESSTTTKLADGRAGT